MVSASSRAFLRQVEAPGEGVMLKMMRSLVILASPISRDLVLVFTICGRMPPMLFENSMSFIVAVGTIFWTCLRKAR